MNANLLAYGQLTGTPVTSHVLWTSLTAVICLVWDGFPSCPALLRPLATHLLIAIAKFGNCKAEFEQNKSRVGLVSLIKSLSQTMEQHAGEESEVYPGSPVT